MIEHSGEFDFSRPFRPWAFRFAKTQIQQFLRSKRRNVVVYDSDLLVERAQSLLEENGKEGEIPFLKRLIVCRQKLPSRLKRLLEMRYERKLTSKEIAILEETSDHAVRCALSDARKRLYGCMTKLCKMSDAAFERHFANSFDDEVSLAIERGLPAEDAEAFYHRLDSEEKLSAFLVQSGTDALLARYAIPSRTNLRRKLFTPLLLAGAAVAATVLVVVDGKTISKEKSKAGETEMNVSRTTLTTLAAAVAIATLPANNASAAATADATFANSLDERLLLHVEFHGDEIKDLSPRHLVCANASSAILKDGKFGDAAWFNGAEPAKNQIGNPAVKFSGFAETEKMTVCAWTKFTVASNGYPRIIDTPCLSFQAPGLRPGNFQFNYNDNGTVKGIYGMAATGWTSNEWHHLAFTVDRSDGKVLLNNFVDGCWTSSGSAENVTPRIATGTVAIGNTTGSDNSRPFGGFIDDVRIYDGILSLREISAIAHDRPPKADAGEDFATSHSEATLFGKRVNPCDIYPDLYRATSCWTQVSGPVAEIAIPENEETKVTLSEEGTYVFRLNVVAPLGEKSDEVTVVKGSESENTPTISMSSSENTCTIPQTVKLSANVSSDSRVTWRKVSGPGNVFFDDVHASKTEAAISEAGDYVLAASADNGSSVAEALLNVTATLAEDRTLTPSVLHATFNWPMNMGLNEQLDDATGQYYIRRPSGILVAGGKTDNTTAVRANAYNHTTYSEINNHDMTDFTIACWVNGSDRTTPYNDYNGIWAAGYESSFVQACPISGDKHVLRFIICNENSKQCYWTTGSGVLPTNGWHHVAFSFNGSSGTSAAPCVYVDGVLYSVTTVAGNNTPTETWKPLFDKAFRFGNFRVNDQNSKRFYDGLITDGRVYNRVLTQAEVNVLASDETVLRAPVLDFPENILCKSGDTVALPVVATDGHGEAPSVIWSVKEGVDANVAIANGNATFRRTGEYVLRAAVRYGQHLIFRDIPVKATPSGTVIYLLGD